MEGIDTSISSMRMFQISIIINNKDSWVGGGGLVVGISTPVF